MSVYVQCTSYMWWSRTGRSPYNQIFTWIYVKHNYRSWFCLAFYVRSSSCENGVHKTLSFVGWHRRVQKRACGLRFFFFFHSLSVPFALYGKNAKEWNEKQVLNTNPNNYFRSFALFYDFPLFVRSFALRFCVCIQLM